MEDVIEPLNITPHEDIAACTNALNAIGEYDYAMLDDEEKELVMMIRKMSLYIIHIGIQEIYTSNFYGEEDTSSSTS
jgi:hypothetical protein